MAAMATATQEESYESGTILREALGRIARLGALYDARTDTFCGGNNMLIKALPSDSQIVCKTDVNRKYTSIAITSSLQEKLKKLEIKGDLKLSILFGMVDLGGSGKYLSEEKTSFNSVESTLLYKVVTVHESLLLYNPDLKEIISRDALINALRSDEATHVVTELYWGANCAITITDENRDNTDKKQIEGSLKLQLEKLQASVDVSAKNEAGWTKEDKDSWSKFSVEIYGDVLPDVFPRGVDGALKMIRNMDQLIQKCNDGKGKPLTFIMSPLSSSFFQDYMDLKISEKFPTFRNLGEKRIVQVIQLLDYIKELKQQVHDEVVDMDNHTYCVTSAEREEICALNMSLEVQEGGVKSAIVPLVKGIRTGVNSNDKCVKDFCDKRRAKANEIFHKYADIHKDVQSRIVFADDCKKWSAECLQFPTDQNLVRARSAYENVYVFFCGQADAETTTKYQLAFLELAKNGRNDSTATFLFTWTGCNGRVRIAHYRKHGPDRDDVVKDMETKDVVQCVPTACPLMPIKLRCPGSNERHCSKEERSWACIICDEILKFYPDSNAVICGCGYAKMLSHQFQFRCQNEEHGSSFVEFKNTELLQCLKSSASPSGNYTHVGCMC